VPLHYHKIRNNSLLMMALNRLKIIIAGSRNITDYAFLIQALIGAINAKVITPAYSFEIVSGGAKGVDTLARRYAQESGYVLTEMKPQYKGKNDRGAPLRRNVDIANYGDVLVAVWDGSSAGTKHMIEYMQKLNKPVYIHKVK
jgi:predicted Rossmann fold nucleotide-binding protein DprA/Smf involved in DNA uptake